MTKKYEVKKEHEQQIYQLLNDVKKSLTKAEENWARQEFDYMKVDVSYALSALGELQGWLDNLEFYPKNNDSPQKERIQ